MNLGRYELETYNVVINGQIVERERIKYTANNGIDFFVERYFGEIREGYSGETGLIKNLNYDSLKTHIIGESIVIRDNSNPPKPLIYLTLSSIQSIQRSGELRLTILDTQVDSITLEFITPYDTNQAYSLLNYVMQNPLLNINNIGVDDIPPQIFFNETFYGAPIVLVGSTLEGPFSTNDGNNFLVNLHTNNFLGPFPMNTEDICVGLIYDVVDNRDENIMITGHDILIYKDVISDAGIINSITGVGVYTVKIVIADLGSNQNDTTITINVI